MPVIFKGQTVYAPLMHCFDGWLSVALIDEEIANRIGINGPKVCLRAGGHMQ